MTQTNNLSKATEKLSSGYRINRAADDAAGLEYERINTDTEFNKKKLLDGTYTDQWLQISANDAQGIEVSIAKMDWTDIDVTGGAAANSTVIATVDDMLKAVSTERSKLGAIQNCLEYTDVLANAEKAIKNESDIVISVSATASAKASDSSEVVLATTALKGTETTKSVFAYLEVAEKADESTVATFAESFNTMAANQLALITKETKKKGMITLAAGDTAATYAGFKIWGDAAAKPAKAWTAGRIRWIFL